MSARSHHFIMSCGFVFISGAAALAQVDRYVIFADSPSTTWVVQGGAISTSWTHQPMDLAPAVRDTIRAVRWDHSGPGNEYNFDGTLTGATYPDPGGSGQILDAGASETHNYFVEWSGNGAVYQCDPDWSHPVQLFTTGRSYTGITYDSSDDTLWLAVDDTGDIYNLTLGGTLIRQFSAGPGRWACLAYEASSDTLWMVNNPDSEIRQYDKDGNLLASLNVGDFGNVWGGEFPVGDSGRYALGVSGQCPGTLTLRWNNATPNRQQGIVYGQQDGQTTIPGGACQGTVLGVMGNVRLVNTIGTGSGSGMINGSAGTAACGGRLQLVESGSCNTSNVGRIP